MDLQLKQQTALAEEGARQALDPLAEQEFQVDILVNNYATATRTCEPSM